MRRYIIHIWTLSVMLVALSTRAQVTAIDDDYLVNENEVWTGDLGANDILPAGTVTYTVVEGPSYGSFNFTTGGNFEYTPPLNEFGFQDSIYYQVCVNNNCDIAGVEFYVIFRNTVPFADEDYFSVEFNTPRTGQVGLNDGDPDSITDPIDTSLDWFKFTNPTNGIVNVFSIDGTFTYTPNTGFTGTDSFQYYVVDHCGLYAISTVYLNVVGPNLNPTASDQTIATLSEDLVYSGSLISLVSDPENDLITFTLQSSPSSGSLQLLSNGTFTYTPLPNFTGNVSFTFNACDAVGQCDQGVVNLTINNVDNDPPQLANDNKIINEDSTGIINTASNDYDDTGSLTYSIFSQPTNGAATLINANGQFSYTPNANYSGFDSFLIQACDGVNCATSTVNVQINGINDAPLATPFTITINEDGNSSGTINSITDAEPNALSISTPGGNTISGLTINNNGTYSYAAPTNYFGTQTINIQGCDPQGLCANTTLTLVVNSVNDLPVITSDSFTINEDQSLTGNLSSGEYDVEGDILSYTASQLPVNGTLNLNSNGQFTYTPNSNWFGSEALSISVCDGQNGCSPSTLLITVSSMNDLPTATPFGLNTNEDVAISANLASYVSDVETSQLSYTIQSMPSSGTFNLASNGSFTFTPSPNYFGSLSTSYQACDASNACVTGLITIAVSSINDAPVASNLNITINEDQAATGLISGISDVDHPNLIITITEQAQNGTITILNNGAYTYTPTAHYFGSESIEYSVCDPLGLCATGAITIQISSIEDIPQVQGESVAVVEGNLLTGDLSANDSDGDGDPLSYTPFGTAQNGILNLNLDGTFSFMPNLGFLGNESFSYLVCDPNGNCASATLSIDVLTSNTAPTALSSALTLDEDELTTASLLENIIDSEGGSFTFTTLEAPEFGTLQWLENGNYIYNPNPNFFGSDYFTYRVCDNGSLCADAQVNLTVIAVNDAPITTISSIEVEEDAILIQNISADVYDAEGDAITYELIVSGTNGIATLDNSGELVYSPVSNFYGIESILYQVCDGSGACTYSTLEIIVTPINDNPQAGGSSSSIQEDEFLQGSLTGLVVHYDEEELFFGTMISPSNGIVTIQNNGAYTYTPNPNFFGVDQFSYLVCDPAGACDTASIIMLIDSVNDAPLVNGDVLQIDEDGAMEINIAANDFDIENQALSYALMGNSLLGTVSLSASGVLYFTAIENLYGTENLAISVCDAEGLCSESQLEIAINPINDLPVITIQPFYLDEDSEITVDLMDYSSDAEPGQLNFTVSESPINGNLEFDTNGVLTFTPLANYNGSEQFPITVCDDQGGCADAFIVLTIVPVNDPPQAQDAQITLSEDSATEGFFNEFAADADNDELFYNILQTTQHGTFVTSGSGAFAYAPTANFFGSDTLYYSACDPTGICDTAHIVFEVTFVNDLPIINNEGVQVIINNSNNGSVAINDVELDFETLIYTLVEDNSGGTFILEADGSYTYTPATDTTGLFTVSYSACDPCNACEYGTLTIFVVAEEEANTPPLAFNYSGQICPGGTIAINLLNLIVDAEDASADLNLSFGTANSGNYQLDAETQELIYEASPFAADQVIIPYYVCDNGVIQMCDTASIVLDILPESTIEITGFVTNQITCFGAANGSISIDAETSLGSINYTWSNGAESSSINQLSAGIYSVVISSEAPCPLNQTAQFEIFEPAQLVASYTINDLNGTNSSIGDSITVFVSGGTPGYNIEWITPTTTIFNESNVQISDNGSFTYTITDGNGCMYSETIVIAGVNEKASNDQILVYPNPITAGSDLTISSAEVIEIIEIIDSQGALVAAYQPYQSTTAINFSETSSGVYTLRILTRTGAFNRRIIKQ